MSVSTVNVKSEFMYVAHSRSKPPMR